MLSYMDASEYEALIFDLDGTAMVNAMDALPSDRMVQAIRLAEPFIKLCPATGRPIDNARPIIEHLELVDPCVISGGTEIYDPVAREIIWRCDINPEDIEPIFEVLRPYPYQLLVDDELMSEGGTAAEHTITEPAHVMYLMECEQDDAATILNALQQIPNISASGVVSWKQHGVDIHITNKEATKEHAIAVLLEMLGISKEKVIGAGDADNDEHLFKAVGYKVAMGNATDNLKARADVVCDTVQNDGLAQFIEQLVAFRTA